MRCIIILILFLPAFDRGYAQETRALPLNLPELLKIALQHAPNIQALAEDEIQHFSDIEKAKAALKPNVHFSAGHIYQRDPNALTDRLNRELKSVQTESIDDYAGSNKTTTNIQLDENTFAAGFGFRQFIYASGLFSARIDFAKERLKKILLEKEVTRQTITATVLDLFFGIYFARQKLAILKTLEALNHKKLQVTQERRSTGDATQVDVMEDSIARQQAQLDINQEQNQMQAWVGFLQNITDLPNLTADQVGSPCLKLLPELDLQKIDTYLARIDQNNPEVKKLAAVIRLAETAHLMAQKTDTLSPKASIFGSFEYIKDGDTKNKDMNWSIGGAVIIPIFDGNFSFHEQRKTFSQVKQAKIALHASRSKLITEIRHLAREINYLNQEQTVLQQKQQLAKLKLTITQASFKNKLISENILLGATILAEKAKLTFWAHRAKQIKTLFELFRRSGISITEQLKCEK